MDSCQILREKIEKQTAKICVIGLGYVGLPLAVAFGQKGYFVYGFDTSASRIEKLNRGEQYIVDVAPQEVADLIKREKFLPTTDKAVLVDCDIYIICVPTPLRKVKLPDISYVVKASKVAQKYLKKGQMVILESTSFPTTTREVVLPILKKSGLKEEEDFFLCFSPERVNPGDKNFPTTKIPKVVGGLSQNSTKLAQMLYAKIIDKIFTVSCPEVAETAKLLENTFRLVNIALANEFAMVCSKLGISIWEVIEAAGTKPFGFMPFYPGPGTGGHCIPCDPLYLSWKAKKLGFKTKMIDLASYINHFMPSYIIDRVEELLKEKGALLADAGILMLGVTYKKDVKDLRESPALDIIEKLQKRAKKVDFYDYLIPYLEIDGIHLKSIDFSADNVRSYDCIIVATDHTEVDYAFLRNNAKLIFDTRNVYKQDFGNVKRL